MVLGRGIIKRRGLCVPSAGLAIGTMNGLIEVNTNGSGIMILS
jgi:hypothetical protein